MPDSRDLIASHAGEQGNVSTRPDAETGGGAARALCLVMACALAGILIVEVLLCLTPPVSRDALIHHLAIPKLWLQNGFRELPWVVFSYYPMNIDLLYLLSLSFSNDILPKFIHMAFGLGTAILLYIYLRRQLGRIWSLLGALIFLSTPIIIRLSTTAYIDLGMLFFITGSMLSFLHWRDTDYRQSRWLVLSALCMGLAAGSKYNAIIAWAYLNLAVIFHHSRDTNRPRESLKYGGLFFAAALIVVSPWLVKNILLTGNPVFPLFDGLFDYFRSDPQTFKHAAAAPRGTFAHNLFQEREWAYGEKLWQVMLLPIRIFFEGKDHVPQYFDGVLNPLLLIMLPFACLGRNLKRDRAFLLSFSVFYFFVAAFTAGLRVRYLIPIIPCLAILAVGGIKNVSECLKGRSQVLFRAGFGAVLAVTGFCLVLNGTYMISYFDNIRPVPYILGEESRDEFISRHVGSYPAMRYVNETLPQDAVVLLMFVGGRGYYMERPYIHHVFSEMGIVRHMVEVSESREVLKRYIESLGCTHVLMREELFERFLYDNYDKREIRIFKESMAPLWRVVYRMNGYAVYGLNRT